jgi:hypothetical protein
MAEVLFDEKGLKCVVNGTIYSVQYVDDGTIDDGKEHYGGGATNYNRTVEGVLAQGGADPEADGYAQVYGMDGSSCYRYKLPWIKLWSELHPSGGRQSIRCQIYTKGLRGFNQCESPHAHGAHIHYTSQKGPKIPYIVATCAQHNNPKTTNGEAGRNAGLYIKEDTFLVKLKS